MNQQVEFQFLTTDEIAYILNDCEAQALFAEARIATARLTQRSQEKTLSELLQHAASFELAKQPIPKTTTDKLAQVRGLIETANRQIAEQEAAKKQLQADYEDKLIRYRELKARTQQQHQGN